MLESRVRGVSLNLLAAALAAGYLIPYKMAAAQASPDALALPLLFIAALLNSTGSAIKGGRQVFAFDRREWVVALLLALCSAAGNEFMAQGLARIDPGLASVILRTQVFWVALGGLFLLREQLSSLFWLGATMALSGFILLYFQRDISQARILGWQGILYVLGAAILFGSMQLIVRKSIHLIDPVRVNALRLWLATGLLACIPGRTAHALSLERSTWALVAIAALFGPVISRILLMLSLRSLPAALSTLLMFASPIFAYVLGGLLLGHWPSATEGLCSVLVLAGIALPILESLRGKSKTSA